jgi:hypothetical protein
LRKATKPVAVVSESLDRIFAPHGRSLGTIYLTEPAGAGQSARLRRVIVGVVHDVHVPPQHWLETLRTVIASIYPDVFVGPSPPLSV